MLVALPAQSMVYTWRDSAGITHYTNKVHEIPPRYKAKAKPLYPEPADMNATNSQVLLNPPKPEPQPAILPESQAAPEEKQKIPSTATAASSKKMPEPSVKSGRRQRVRGLTEE
jgi:hypothetical protein